MSVRPTNLEVVWISRRRGSKSSPVHPYAYDNSHNGLYDSRNVVNTEEDADAIFRIHYLLLVFNLPPNWFSSYIYRKLIDPIHYLSTGSHITPGFGLDHWIRAACFNRRSMYITAASSNSALPLIKQSVWQTQKHNQRSHGGHMELQHSKGKISKIFIPPN